MEKKITFFAVLVALAGLIVGVSFYLLTGEQDEEAALDEPSENHPAVREKGSENQAEEDRKVDEGVQADHIEKRPDMRADMIPEAEKPEAPPKRDPREAKADAARNEMIKQEVPRIYGDLFRELALPEEQRKQVENHLTKSLISESEFEAKLFDPNITVEDLLRDQERLSGELRNDIGRVLSPQEQDLVTKHQNELPKRAQQQELNMLVESLNLQGADKENAKTALERAMNNMEARKKFGEYTAQDITEVRKQFNGAKPGDPDFMRASIDISENRVNTFMKDLEQLPKEQYDAIKKQMEMPIEMMRRGIKPQAKPPGAP